MKPVIAVGAALLGFVFGWNSDAGRKYTADGDHGWRAAFALVFAIVGGALAYSAILNS
jgi:hypothetical protein